MKKIISRQLESRDPGMRIMARSRPVGLIWKPRVTRDADLDHSNTNSTEVNDHDTS